jgi:O-acetyl-ADP-ribose deacetylase (regulator of RNase III)
LFALGKRVVVNDFCWKEEVSRIALKTVMDYLKDHPDITLVRFVLFDSGTYRAYEEAMQELDTQDEEKTE